MMPQTQTRLHPYPKLVFTIPNPPVFFTADNTDTDHNSQSESRSSSTSLLPRRPSPSSTPNVPNVKPCFQTLLSGPNTVNDSDVRRWKPSADEHCAAAASFDDSSGVKGNNIPQQSSHPIPSLGSSSNYPTEDDGEVTSERKPCARALHAKKGRCARVDNLSKRRRRKRINGKIRMLRELIPNCCSKADKASMLDEAIEYLKILQLHLQIMCLRSRVCGYRAIVASAVKWAHLSVNVMGRRMSSGVGGPFISILPQPQPFQMPVSPARLITPVPFLPVFGEQSLLPT